MKARRKFRQSKSHAIAWVVLLAMAAIIFLCFRSVGSVFAAYNDWTSDLPVLNSESFSTSSESYMYASDGKTQLAKFQLEKRDPVDISEISDYAKKATVDVEDVRFYEHNGVDMQGILRAVINNLSGGALEGASTITQQLVRNTALSQEATNLTLKRKAREAELALAMEKEYSKEEILNMYLNTINYGDGCYGIEAAAQNYFQKSAADLNLVQSATLAGIPQSPNELNPKENPDKCLERRNLVLDRMLSAGDITQEQHDKAVKKRLRLNPAPDEPLQGIYAYPYFTSFARDELMKSDNIYGCSYADLFQGGLKIYTTLDVDMQKKAEQACADQYGNMDEGMDAALVAMDPTTGYVKAIVGGNDFYTDQWNIATQGGRPSGSTFKVFTLAAAIESGTSPQAAIDCSNPVTLTSGQTINNFDKVNYGMRTIADATAISSNTGFYRLAEKVGVDSLIEMAHRLGIDSELAPYPIITLGTENVTPLEMAEAYSSLASGGVHRDPVIITRIENKDGEVLFENADTSERVMEESVAGAVTEVLRGVFEKSYATAYGSGPSNGQPVAGKTGTGVEFRDHWLVGYSPMLTCAAWIGNRDYSSTSESLTANSLWHDFMSRAHEGVAIKQFPTVSPPTYNTNQSEMLLDEDDAYYYYDYDDEDDDSDSKSKSSASARSDDDEDDELDADDGSDDGPDADGTNDDETDADGTNTDGTDVNGDMDGTSDGLNDRSTDGSEDVEGLDDGGAGDGNDASIDDTGENGQ